MRTMARLASLLAAILAVTGVTCPAPAAEPVQITYGYHPYWTGAWYGVILKKGAVEEISSAREHGEVRAALDRAADD